jgi:hypothetical protein
LVEWGEGWAVIIGSRRVVIGTTNQRVRLNGVDVMK